MENKGWIKLHRKITEGSLWHSEPFTRAQAWVDLILIANHKDGFVIVRGNIVEVKRGQVGRSETTLATRWKWSRHKVRNFLKYLESSRQIKQQKSPVLSIVTLKKYEEYQEGERQSEQRRNGKRTADEQRRNTNKNAKNEKNGEEVVGAERSDNVGNDIFHGLEKLEKMEGVEKYFVLMRDLKGLGKKRSQMEILKFLNFWRERNEKGIERWQKQEFFEIDKKLNNWILKIKDKEQ